MCLCVCVYVPLSIVVWHHDRTFSRRDARAPSTHSLTLLAGGGGDSEDDGGWGDAASDDGDWGDDGGEWVDDPEAGAWDDPRVLLGGGARGGGDKPASAKANMHIYAV